MEIITLAGLLLVAAETTYLVANQTGKTKHSKKQQMPIFVDTSVLIDGRIISIAESGFITSTLFIPRSVVGELQFLADNGDSDKRSRARHGLDVVSELQAMSRVKTEIFSDSTKAEEGVDNRLLSLAKQYKGMICTIDFNLNKVAQVEGIPVLNVNDLAMNLRMAYLPGEKTKLELTQKGNDQHQAVGHLGDGTMVVVEHASQYIGKAIEVEFIRSLQTAAGKMMFARVAGTNQPKQPRATQPKGRQPRSATTPAPVAIPVPPLAEVAPAVASEALQTRENKNTNPRQNNNRNRQPQVQQQPKPQAQTQNQQSGSRPPRNNNRRRNNEDSLIELANKQ